MRKEIALVFALLMLSVLISGCAKPAEEAPALESGFGADVESDLADLDSLDEEMDLAELDGIDKELAEIDALFG
jgi:hypothetical protein